MLHVFLLRHVLPTSCTCCGRVCAFDRQSPKMTRWISCCRSQCGRTYSGWNGFLFGKSDKMKAHQHVFGGVCWTLQLHRLLNGNLESIRPIEVSVYKEMMSKPRTATLKRMRQQWEPSWWRWSSIYNFLQTRVVTESLPLLFDHVPYFGRQKQTQMNGQEPLKTLKLSNNQQESPNHWSKSWGPATCLTVGKWSPYKPKTWITMFFYKQITSAKVVWSHMRSWVWDDVRCCRHYHCVKCQAQSFIAIRSWAVVLDEVQRLTNNSFGSSHGRRLVRGSPVPMESCAKATLETRTGQASACAR